MASTSAPGRVILKSVNAMLTASADCDGQATRALFRQFMKVARQIERDGMHMELRMPVDREAWLMKGGSHNWGKTPREYRADTLRRLLPWVAEVSGGGGPQRRASLPPLEFCVERALPRP